MTDTRSRAPPARRTLAICLINPKFEPSYWGFDYALPLYPGDKRCTMITGALPALAGLVPSGHEVVLLDENVEPIDFEALRRFDVVGVTGMNVQKKRMREILLNLHGHGAFVVVGGAYPSVDPAYFDGLCDALFKGEAETTWPAFLDDYAAGRPTARVYAQSEQTDMTRVPKPRYDLLQVSKYASGALQFSRGCPFQCEFCDIIVTFGRVPRMKLPEQVIEELDDMRRAGFFSAMIVDDNFIGNKAAAKGLLRIIVPWQERHGYPLRLMTEASINLADDAELLELMYAANFRQVFIGIETPREASLRETKKLQNLRGDSQEAKLARIRQAGIDISAGFIVGFDNDDKAIFEEHYRFIQDNGITLAMVGMLQAVPTTPLYDRLKVAGRLVESDDNLNIVPAQMTREELREGYWNLVRRLYAPEAFLERYFRGSRYPEYHRRRAEISRKANEGKLLPTLVYGLLLLWSLFWALLRDGSLTRVGAVYARYFVRVNRRYRKDVVGFAQFMNRCVTHWHFYRFTREAIAGRLRLYNSG
ncbi:MAG: DUF4070 domain-containing protein [Planctomycetes bacterium]|nr:DUF4070 domain-containing protein [Planctomycetota bacterium]